MTFTIRVSTFAHTLRPIAECAEKGDADLIVRALNNTVPSAIFSYADTTPLAVETAVTLDGLGHERTDVRP